MQPINTTLQEWAQSLIVDFPYDNVPILLEDTEWKEWGNFLGAELTFADNAIPPTDTYTTWDTWANDVYLCLSQLQF
jgi:hypothetical protein